MNSSMTILQYDVTAVLRMEWTTLVTRQRGKELLADLLKKVHPETNVVTLDFDMVSIIDASFADSFLIPLLRRAKERGWRVVGVNASPMIVGMAKPGEQLNKLLRNSHFPFLLVGQDGKPNLLGCEAPYASKVLKKLWEGQPLTLDQMLIACDIERAEAEAAVVALGEIGYAAKRTSRQGVVVHEAALRDELLQYAASGYLGTLSAALTEDGGVVERGHFVLPSGAHVDRIYHTMKLLGSARLARRVGWEMAKRMAQEEVDFVLVPETPSCVVLGHETALSLGANCAMACARRVGRADVLQLESDIVIPSKSRVAIVVDVVATGLVVRSLLRGLHRTEASIAGICSLIDVSGGRASFPQYNYSNLIAREHALHPDSAACPLCAAGDVAASSARILPEPQMS